MLGRNQNKRVLQLSVGSVGGTTRPILPRPTLLELARKGWDVGRNLEFNGDYIWTLKLHMEINLSLQEKTLGILYREEGKEEQRGFFCGSAAGGMEVSAVASEFRLHWVLHLQWDSISSVSQFDDWISSLNLTQLLFRGPLNLLHSFWVPRLLTSTGKTINIHSSSKYGPPLPTLSPLPAVSTARTNISKLGSYWKVSWVTGKKLLHLTAPFPALPSPFGSMETVLPHLLPGASLPEPKSPFPGASTIHIFIFELSPAPRFLLSSPSPTLGHKSEVWPSSWWISEELVRYNQGQLV